MKISVFRAVFLLSLVFCGYTQVTPESVARIIGGQSAGPSDWPWMASIRLKTDGKHICSGSLISTTEVITAASCVMGKNPTDIFIVLGSYTLTTATPQTNVGTIDCSTNYHTVGDSGDICVVHLSAAVLLTGNIAPISIPDAAVTIPTGLPCVALGWGQSTSDSSQTTTDILQYVTVPAIDYTTCNQLYNTPSSGAAMQTIKSDMICAGYVNGGKSACLGDYGGALACSESNRWYLVGVISFTVGCGLPYRPGVNTLVTSYASFIKGLSATANVKSVKFTSPLVDINTAAPVSVPTSAIFSFLASYSLYMILSH